MSEQQGVVYSTTEEKARLNLSVAAGTREKLMRAAGGERSIGTYLGALMDRLDAGHTASDSLLVDASSIRQIVDGGGVDHSEPIPSVAAKKRGAGGKIVFGIISWQNGRPVGLKYPYDAQGLGWAATNVQGAILSQCMAQLAGEGWALIGQQGDLLIFTRPRPLVPTAEPSVN